MRALARRIAEVQSAMASPRAHLDEMALAVSAVVQPGLDAAHVLSELDAIAQGCTDRTRDGVIRYLADECHFAGDHTDYHDWQNSCLDRVIGRRRGMPITLSIVAIEVARRVGVELVGVGMPGHFLVGDRHDNEWFADPFSGATGLGLDDCRSMLERMGSNSWHPSMVEPTPKRLITVRVLNNLRASCERAGDLQRLALVMRLRAVITEAGDRPDAVRRATSVWN